MGLDVEFYIIPMNYKTLSQLENIPLIFLNKVYFIRKFKGTKEYFEDKGFKVEVIPFLGPHRVHSIQDNDRLKISWGSIIK